MNGNAEAVLDVLNMLDAKRSFGKIPRVDYLHLFENISNLLTAEERAAVLAEYGNDALDPVA